MSDFKSGQQYTGSEIAIIGMAGRFPGAGNIEQFWQNIRNGVESISFFKEDELDPSVQGIAQTRLPNYVKACGILDNIEYFDAAFFGFNPREAELMDPQQRLFLECAWEAFENAGYDPDSYNGLIGVYAGASINTYQYRCIYRNRKVMNTMGEYQVFIANCKDLLPMLVAYKLNLKGPSMNIQSACSTSLVAVHVACQSLLNNECDLALAGSITVKVPQKEGYLYSEGMILSPDGHCRPFDAKAKGTVFSNGVGIVILKRLAEAIRDKDTIHAVIRGSAVNNDGAAKAGFTAPGVAGQAEVISQAQAVAGVEPGTIGYIETHGTGTDIGDPIEIKALARAFGSGLPANSCPIGSVKSNIGHLDVAAGISGLIKTVMAMKHRELPPSLFYETPNPVIDFAHSPFYVNTELKEWKPGAFPLRAGISSFGFGGTNAHIILEAAPAGEKSGTAKEWQLLLLSAKTKAALEAQSSRVLEYLKQNCSLELADICYTLQAGRKAFNHRQAVLCNSIANAVSALESGDSGRVFTAYEENRNRPVMFLFPGTAGQCAELAYALYHSDMYFKKQADACLDKLKMFPYMAEISINAFLEIQGAGALPGQTGAAPALQFIAEYCLARLWMRWGVQPQALIGYGTGEYTAACLAEIFSVETALQLILQQDRQLPQMHCNAPRIPIVSCATGQWLKPGEAMDIAYWTQLEHTTDRFTEGLSVLLKTPGAIFLETGSGNTLAARLLQHPEFNPGCTVFAHSTGSIQELTLILGKMWLAGAQINWENLQGTARSRVPLPSYPFERQRYWIAPDLQTAENTAGGAPDNNAGTIAALHKRPQLKNEYTAPAGKAEMIIARIWKEFLGINAIGIHDDFFELGGDSLLATQVVSKVRQTFQVELPLGALLEKPTISYTVEKLSLALGDKDITEEVAGAIMELDGISEQEARQLLTDLESGIGN